jgi:potassium efflux system protein
MGDLYLLDSEGLNGEQSGFGYQLLSAIFVFAISVLAAKNIPGAVEMMISQTITINPGIRYTTISLIRYIIFSVGLLSAFNIMGMKWDDIQWLVAALSVGLGFGLQEIFANFVSGLIILFERPIRVGDIITLETTSGIVSDIRIRSVTITDWDRKEYIVPNKDVLTGRLLNWTLSNTTNRIVIPVGIDYDDDPALAIKLLKQVADEHPVILSDPEPLVSFEGFGDHAQKLMLRCYLPTLDRRIFISTEIHLAIRKAFEEHGITICFQQLDLHVKQSELSLGESKESQELGGEGMDRSE